MSWSFGRALWLRLCLLLSLTACEPPPATVPVRSDTAAVATTEHLATPAVSAYAGPPRGRGAMGGIHPSRMASSLAQAGLDIKALPPLESLAPGPKQRVMRTFSEALGVPCVSCHAVDEFKADTKRKRVAKRMWNEIVRVVAMSDGAPVYCDSCHDGALFHLDRRNREAVAAYMCNAMVGGMKRIDGRPHDCTSCHGDPPDFLLITSWKALPAPEITNDATTVGVLIPKWPSMGPREPMDCGPDAKLCPLAALMRLVVAPALVAEDRAKLGAALDLVTTFAPENETFTRTAKVTAAAAWSGNFVAVRDGCAACHASQKASWVQQNRRRQGQLL